jgi:ubiquinone/menaquinone biosynthesis C-methylase UbiE
MINIFQKLSNYYEQANKADRYQIQKLIEFAAEQIKPSELVLDAGSGKQQYKKYFSHAKYESTDIVKLPDAEHDFICSLDDIPKPDGSYDTVLCTQVLEHVEFPQKVISEFSRILKPGGKLFLTAPQSAAIHGAPYHFFNFTEYGLASMFTRAGFMINFIRPNGGGFWDLSKRISSLPRDLEKQYKTQKNEGNLSLCDKLKWTMLRLCLLLFKPTYKYIIPMLFFKLDSFDKTKLSTLGYSCYCIKPEN